MQTVATFVTDPLRADLGEEVVDSAIRALASAGADIEGKGWLDDGVACDVVFTGPAIAEARAILDRSCAGESFDVVVQPFAGRRKALLIADMDATIVEGETLDELAEAAGIKDRISAITARAMRGEIEFKSALRERVAMLKGLRVASLEATYRRLKLNPGAHVLVRTMRANGAFTLLVSGGFRYFVSRIAEAAGFDAFDCNDFEIEGDRLTGRVTEPVLDKDAKLAALRRFADTRNVRLADTMATGDGANDLPMIKAAGLGVAYHAKPLVEAEAQAAIRHGDLTALLYIQGYRRMDFRTG
jgi:phosphoserine phosphatase